MGGVSASDSDSAYAGGLIGNLNSGNTMNGYATGSVSASAFNSPYAGGFVGYLISGNITNGYATGGVSADSGAGTAYAGGFVGQKSGGTVANSYAAGDVSAVSGGTVSAGGIVGRQTGGSISACVFDTQGTGQEYGVGNDHANTDVTAKTNAEMTNGSTITELSGWTFRSNYYPQNPTLAAAFPDASAFSVVPVKFADTVDTSKSVASPFRIPRNTPTPVNDTVTLTYSPLNAFTRTVDGSDWLLTPVYSGDITLTATAGAMTKSFSLKTLYPPPNSGYAISLSVSGTYTFPGAIEGYGGVTSLDVTVINTGSQPTDALSLLLSGANSADFALSSVSLSSIAVGSDDVFSVAPVAGLGVGTYTANVTVSGDHGITAGFGLSFTVNPPGSGVIPVTGLSLSSASIVMTIGDSQTLDALVAPDNATSKDVNWQVVNNAPLSPDVTPFVVTIEPNNVTVRDRTCKSSNTQALAAATRRLTVAALGAGTAVIRATTLDGGFTADCSVTVSPTPPTPPVPPALPPEDEIVSPDVILEEPVTPDPETVPPCTLPLEDEGTEYIGEIDVQTASGTAYYRPKADEILAYEVNRSFHLDRGTLTTVLNLIHQRTGKSIPYAEIAANPGKYADELFSVLLFQQEITEGPHSGTYVWLVPGMVEPAEAMRLGIVTFSSASGGVDAVLKFFVADDKKSVKFVNGELIVGDGQKNGKLTDLVWLNARAPADTRKIDGGSGCGAVGPVMGLVGVVLLVLLGRKRSAR
jgi:uncharacterized protein YjdB